MNKPVQQRQHMAEMHQPTRQNISLHLKNIFADNELVRVATDKEYLSVQTEAELAETAVANNFFTTASHGRNYRGNFHKLDAMICAGRLDEGAQK